MLGVKPFKVDIVALIDAAAGEPTDASRWLALQPMRVFRPATRCELAACRRRIARVPREDRRGKRRERRLAEDVARPMIFYAPAANCWSPKVKGLTVPINGIYNGWRMEDAWLDN